MADQSRFNSIGMLRDLPGITVDRLFRDATREAAQRAADASPNIAGLDASGNVVFSHQDGYLGPEPFNGGPAGKS